MGYQVRRSCSSYPRHWRPSVWNSREQCDLHSVERVGVAFTLIFAVLDAAISDLQPICDELTPT